MSEEMKNVRMEEFSEVEVESEERRKKEWEREWQVKVYRIYADEKQGMVLYENQSEGKRILVKVFGGVAYVISEKVKRGENARD